MSPRTEDDGSVTSLLASLGSDGLPHGVEVQRVAKRWVSVVAESMKRSLASALASELLADPVEAGSLVIGCFQRRAYFEQEELRYGALGAAGSTVLVACADGTPVLTPPIQGIDLAGRPELSRCWVLVTVGATTTAALVAVDDGRLLDRGASLESSRSFLARWTFRRREAVDVARHLTAELSPRLGTRTLARIETILHRADTVPGGPEEALGTALEVISGGLFEARPRRGVLGERRDPSLELDLLTGLPNRRFLEQHLLGGARESAARVLALLVDVDDLGRLNSKLGEEAGDAALIGVAAALRQECRPGDLVVRSGDDEFIVLAQLDARVTPADIAERFVGAVRAMRMTRPYESARVTASIGGVLTDPTRLPYDRLTDGLQLAKLLGKDGARLVE